VSIGGTPSYIYIDKNRGKIAGKWCGLALGWCGITPNGVEKPRVFGPFFGGFCGRGLGREQKPPPCTR